MAGYKYRLKNEYGQAVVLANEKPILYLNPDGRIDLVEAQYFMSLGQIETAKLDDMEDIYVMVNLKSFQDIFGLK